ncbi:MAG: NADP-dependent malic enzyme [Patescibacteria group bacterium]|jgi:malate dehydrogenase (oxaloacetate-decarboxylating)
MDSITYHRKLKGKIEIISRAKIKNKKDLSLAYTPGVAEACLVIEKNKNEVYELTRKNNLVAVITDGSAVLGLGNIGPEASLPVMEGKCALLKEFAGVDAFPIALKTQDTGEIIKTIVNISPMFGGINLEDISAPRCFEIEKRLGDMLDIPVFHDDQHGTAIVVLAGLINALKVVGKNIDEIKVAINGAGAAGTAIAKLFLDGGVKNIIMVDSKGIISKDRTDLEEEKVFLASVTNKENLIGGLKEAVVKADVFVGVSKPAVLTVEMIKTMNEQAIIFALANPTPEIMPDLAKKAGAAVVATGRSDFPNQINNVLVFPGIFRGLLDSRIKKVTTKMKLSAAIALAGLVKKPSAENILPNVFEKGVSKVIAKSVKET